jgi:hypothetical protein
MHLERYTAKKNKSAYQAGLAWLKIVKPSQAKLKPKVGLAWSSLGLLENFKPSQAGGKLGLARLVRSPTL